MMQPHMISQWPPQRRCERFQMKRLSTNSSVSRLKKTTRFRTNRLGRRKTCQPRLKYIHVGGRCSHMV